MPKIHEGEYGFRLILDTGYDFTGFDSLTLKVEKPDGTVSSKSATTTDPTSGELYYTVESGFFDTPGRHRLQGEIAFTGKTLKTEMVTIKVLTAL